MSEYLLHEYYNRFVSTSFVHAPKCIRANSSNVATETVGIRSHVGPATKIRNTIISTGSHVCISTSLYGKAASDVCQQMITFVHMCWMCNVVSLKCCLKKLKSERQKTSRIDHSQGRSCNKSQ